MQVLPCSEIRYGDCSKKTSSRDLSFDKESEPVEREELVQSTNDRVTCASKTMETPQTERQVDALQTNGASHDRIFESQQFDSHGHEDDDDDDMDNANKPNNCHIVANTTENEFPNGNREEGASLVKPAWLEGDESIALWAMWRGKWQAGIRCSTADWPLSTLKTKPAHDGKDYFIIFFPQTRIHSWADMSHVCPIHECPHPIAYKAHRIGLDTVKDLTVARRFVMQKLAVAMLSVVEQFRSEALIATARDVAVWKEFATEASRCNGYPDLGRMLLKLQNMISSRYINAEWLLSSFNLWVRRCQSANTAESIEILKEEFFNSIRWNEIQSLKEAQIQPTLGAEWKTLKHEVMKMFSMANPVTGIDLQRQSSDVSLSKSPQVSRKRPKLEVRRAESHAFQVESWDSDQSGTVEIDSEFFNNRDIANPIPTVMPGVVADKWNEIVVEPQNGGMVRQTNGVEMTPVDQVASAKALDSENKNRQCTAYIESKGRQCVRWANDGDVYCCVHLSSRFASSSAKAEGALFNDTPMCDGTTVLGTKCKHRSLPGLSFCKKHRPKTDTQISNLAENPLKRKYEENIASLETTHGKELALVGDAALEVDPIMVMHNVGPSNVVEKPKLLAIEYKSTESCIASCLRDNSSPCLESPKRHGLYCKKHLPSWLKRARNGKSRIVSKEVFVELLRDCHAREQKVQLHQACELFYRLFKSILSLRNQVPKEVQFQWALSEASKDIGVGDFFMKLVSREKERLIKVWGFSADDGTQVLTIPVREEPAQLTNIPDVSHDDEKSIRCKVCSELFLDDQTLGNHWRDSHKKEAQWIFRGYACAICLDSFTNKKVLESHVQERHHVQFVEQCMLLQCIPCGGHFGNAEELWLHVLSAHPEDFRLSKEAQAQAQPAPPPADESPPKPELCSLAPVESNNEKLSGSRRFVCKLCGLRFDLLPDLGRHHQAAHMGPSLISSRPAKRGVRYYAYRMKSGRLSRPKFKKTAAAASFRIRNRAADNIKKRIQASKALSTTGISVQPWLAEAPSISFLEESQCSSVAQILFSEVQKTKPRPNNADILSIARSACCKINLKASLEAKCGVLPERLYLKAAKICGENNILVTWHQDRLICPNGCKVSKDPQLSSHLKTLSNGIVGRVSARSFEPVDEKYQMDECHYVLDSADLGPKSMQSFHVLCDDMSFGRESVRVTCVVDHGLSNSDPIVMGDGQSRANMPWESFTYITKPLIDQSISLDAQSFKMGCVCRNTFCRPETCDHVYLFDCDYDDARDIYGKPMRGRFPYDDRSRIILEEGYLVYECNQMCSCPKTCPNRVLQNGVRVKLEVFKTEEKGWAVRAGEAIMRGTFICEYVGEVLDEQEANVRRERYGKEGCGYLFKMDSHVNDMSRLIEGQSRYVIDATKYGNVSRFINHSCLPNLVSHQVLVESMDCQGSHIGLYANRDISLGEELTYNYRCSFVTGEGFSCECGASICRGRLQ